jgi:hypothetical protein
LVRSDAHQHLAPGQGERDHDLIGDLVRLRRDKASSNRVALRPHVFAIVGEALGVLVDDDPEDDAVQTGDDAAVYA